MTRDQAVVRVSSVCKARRIPIDATDLLGLSTYLVDWPDADRAFTRAARICQFKGVPTTGAQLLALTRYLVHEGGK